MLNQILGASSSAGAHRVAVTGESGPWLVLAHGLGGRTVDWGPVVDAFKDRYRVLTFAPAGSADADPGLFSPARHSSPIGFADDISTLLGELGLRDVFFVGHSMSANAGAIAAAGDPGLFRALVLINGSPRYFDDPASGYHGGFTQAEVDDLLLSMTRDYQAWAGGFGVEVMANPERPGLGKEFVRILRTLEPQVAQISFRTAFTSDSREIYPSIGVPTLVLQTQRDPAVPMSVAHWVADAIPGAELSELRSVGHFPHIVDPDELITAIAAFLSAQTGARR